MKSLINPQWFIPILILFIISSGCTGLKTFQGGSNNLTNPAAVISATPATTENDSVRNTTYWITIDPITDEKFYEFEE